MVLHPGSGTQMALPPEWSNKRRVINRRRLWLGTPTTDPSLQSGPYPKDRYPLTAIDRYVTWRREDGQLLDPCDSLRATLIAALRGPSVRRRNRCGS